MEEKVLQIGLIRMVGANVYFFGSEICFSASILINIRTARISTTSVHSELCNPCSFIYVGQKETVCLGQRICGSRFLRIVDSHTHFGICATIIQIPFIFIINHPFDEHRSVYILPALFETIHRAEERFVETGDETGWVIGVEEGLSGSGRISICNSQQAQIRLEASPP